MALKKSAWTKEGKAKVIKGLQGIKICPVTNGLPTTMTLEGFKAACDRCREQDKHQLYHAKTYKHTWCDTCQGKQQPGELRIVPLSQLREKREAKRRGQEMRQHPLAK